MHHQSHDHHVIRQRLQQGGVQQLAVPVDARHETETAPTRLGNSAEQAEAAGFTDLGPALLMP